MDREQIIQMAWDACKNVESRYQMSGLSDGLYADFACDVALEVATAIRRATKEEDARICEGYYERNLADRKIEKADGAYACYSAIRASK